MNDRSDVAQIHVLVADDDSEQREYLHNLLREMGCRVDVAVDGTEAVRKTRQLGHDIVVMDLGMPKMNGWDAIREIRRERGASTYIIAVSGYEDADARRTAFDAGCHEYLVKPLDVRGAIRTYLYRTGRRPLVAG